MSHNCTKSAIRVQKSHECQFYQKSFGGPNWPKIKGWTMKGCVNDVVNCCVKQIFPFSCLLFSWRHLIEIENFGIQMLYLGLLSSSSWTSTWHFSRRLFKWSSDRIKSLSSSFCKKKKKKKKKKFNIRK